LLEVFQRTVDQELTSPFVLRTPLGARMEFDAGYADTPGGQALLLEAWAHQGPPKTAQKKKIVADAFKLAFGATLMPGPTRLVLLFSDPEALAPLISTRAWSAGAFTAFNIEAVVIDLPEDECERIRLAQARQYR